jgi:glucose/arabinose dehydrogenase
VLPGKFHGWPEYGNTVGEVPLMEDDPGVVAPIWDSGESHPTPTQLIAYKGNRYGDEFKGNLFFGTFSGGKVHRIILSGDGTKALSHEIVLEFDHNEPIVGFAETPDGFIYFATTTAIYRVNSLGGVE